MVEQRSNGMIAGRHHGRLVCLLVGGLVWCNGATVLAEVVSPLNQAQSAFKNHQYREAANLLAGLDKDGMLSLEGRRLFARTHLRLGHPKEALHQYDRIAEAIGKDDREFLREVALGFVVVLVKDMREQMRGAAYTALKELNSPEAIPFFEDGLSDASGIVRALVVESLGRLEVGRKSPRLNQAVEDQAGVVKAKVLKVLGEAGDPRSVPLFEQALNHELPGVRVAAYGGLFRSGRKEMWERIERSAAASFPDERTEALRMMGELGDPRGIPILLDSLAHQQPSVRGTAARVLGRLGRQEAATRLVPLLHDPVAAVREAAVTGLGDIGSSESVAVIRERLDDSNYAVRAAAVAALLQMGQPFETVRATSQDLMSRSDPGARTAIAHALGKAASSNAQEGVSSLKALATDPLPGPRILALRSLGRIGGERDIPYLKQALQDSDDAVRATAGGALAKVLDSLPEAGNR